MLTDIPICESCFMYQMAKCEYSIVVMANGKCEYSSIDNTAQVYVNPVTDIWRELKIPTLTDFVW